jgi:hypothetical protein
MPRGVTEISQGNQFSRSANEGQLADSATRSFRVLLNSPSEVFDIQANCGVFVGDPHPTNPNIYCASFDAKYDGDSRMVLVATFNYQSEESAQQSGGGGTSKTISPENRPPDWSLTSELVEVPVRNTRRRELGLLEEIWQDWKPPMNPALDFYESLTKMEPMAVVKVSKFKLGGGVTDPTHDAFYVGYINSVPQAVGRLVVGVHKMMFRSFSATPAVESYGRFVKIGWRCEYTFTIRRQNVDYYVPPSPMVEVAGDAKLSDIDIGWDAAIIVEGRNVKCFDVAAAVAAGEIEKDPYGQPLKVGEDKVPLIPASPELADGLLPLDRAPACVKIPGFSDRGVSQAPASLPIALNWDGTPRKIDDSRGPLVERHQIYKDADLFSILELRLQ